MFAHLAPSGLWGAGGVPANILAFNDRKLVSTFDHVVDRTISSATEARA
jgi:hypothetical protein